MSRAVSSLNQAEPKTLLFIGVLVYFLFKLFVKDSSKKDEGGDDEPNNTDFTADELEAKLKKNDELQKYFDAGVYRTFGYDSYTAAANELFTLMDGIGTKDSSIISKLTFYVRNDVDWICLYNAFGYKRPVNFSLIADGGNLRTWLKDDLSDNSIKEVNEYFKSKGMIKRI